MSSDILANSLILPGLGYRVGPDKRALRLVTSFKHKLGFSFASVRATFSP